MSNPMWDYIVPLTTSEICDVLKKKDAEIAKLQAFKDFVHRRLDEAGIPTHPDGEHSKAGCRIGDRLDIVLNRHVSLMNRVKELEDAIRVERTGLAAALADVVQMADGYRWITEGRGPYTYDDTEYRKEAGYMIDAIINIASPALTKAGIAATEIINKPF